MILFFFFFFSSRRRHTRWNCDWSSDVCSSDLAVGTVLVPEMTSRVSSGDHAGARSAQNRAIEFALLLAVPCVVAFIVIPNIIMRGLFMRGAFNAEDAHAAAMTLVAYTIGL